MRLKYRIINEVKDFHLFQILKFISENKFRIENTDFQIKIKKKYLKQQKTLKKIRNYLNSDLCTSQYKNYILSLLISNLVFRNQFLELSKIEKSERIKMLARSFDLNNEVEKYLIELESNRQITTKRFKIKTFEDMKKIEIERSKNRVK